MRPLELEDTMWERDRTGHEPSRPAHGWRTNVRVETGSKTSQAIDKAMTLMSVVR